MLEIELKIPVVDFAPVERRLAEWGAPMVAERDDADHYFNAPDRDFARTDEALRLRRIGSANLVTYKGPKRGTQAKIRTEIEVPLAGGDRAAADFEKLLTCLGYRPVAVVRKHRRVFHLERAGFSLEICLDEVAELGRFAELEIVAPEDRQAAAHQVLEELARELGLSGSERRSYLELLLERRAKEAP